MSYGSKPEPEVYWTDMSDATFTAQHAPWSSAWLATLARNTVANKHALYGTGSFTGNVPHTHETAEDAYLAPTQAVNLLLASSPSVYVGGREHGGFPWRSSGWRISTRSSLFGTIYGEDERRVTGGVRGGWLTQVLFALDGTDQAQMFGDGHDMVLSFYARSLVSLTQGMIQFGFASSSDSKAVDEDIETDIAGPGEFMPQQSAIIGHHDLSTSWQRFFVRCKHVGRGAQGEIKAQWSTLQTHDGWIEMTGFNVTMGRRLYPWSTAAGDYPQPPSTFGNSGWQNTPSDVPVLDWDIAMTNAVELEAV